MSYATLEFYFLSAILPKSILSIWPSSVVPTRSNVTLWCVTFEQNIICDFQRGSNNLDPWIPQNLRKRPSKLHSSWGVPGWFDFYLTGLEESDAGYYTCVCYGQDDPDVPLQNSDAILLLITGEEGLPQNGMCQSIRGRKGGIKGDHIQISWGKQGVTMTEILLLFVCMCMESGSH